MCHICFQFNSWSNFSSHFVCDLGLGFNSIVSAFLHEILDKEEDYDSKIKEEFGETHPGGAVGKKLEEERA